MDGSSMGIVNTSELLDGCSDYLSKNIPSLNPANRMEPLCVFEWNGIQGLCTSAYKFLVDSFFQSTLIGYCGSSQSFLSSFVPPYAPWWPKWYGGLDFATDFLSIGRRCLWVWSFAQGILLSCFFLSPFILLSFGSFTRSFGESGIKFPKFSFKTAT